MLLAALLVAALPTTCDFERLLRAIDQSSLPPRVARNVAAKVRYAGTMRKVGSIAPTSPQDELRIAREMAQPDAPVVHAIDDAIACLPNDHSLPARLTIHNESGVVGTVMIDDVRIVEAPRDLTVQLAAGTHAIAFDGVAWRANTTVTLAEGEPRSIVLDVQPVRFDRKREFFLAPNLPALVSDPFLPTLGLAVYRGDGRRATMKTVERVAIEKRGVFEATDLFRIDERGAVTVADAGALREILREPGPFVVRVAGSTVDGDRIDLRVRLTYGREIVIRGTVPENVRRVQRNGFRDVPVNDGRFTITVPEGNVSLLAWGDDPKQSLFLGSVNAYCDADVKFTPQALEIVSGGCVAARSKAWSEGVVNDLERVQWATFTFTNGVIAPHWCYTSDAKPIEAENEETLRTTAGVPGVLHARAFSESGILVSRATIRLELYGGGDIPPSNSFDVKLPLDARFLEIQGWSPGTSGRFDLTRFSKN